MGRQKPIEILDNNWRIWGVPVELDWWSQESIDTVRELCLYNKDHGVWFAARVAAALEQLRAWIRLGLKVKGRTWIDIGGGSGHYSVALKLLDAANVTLVDPILLNKWAEPVCNAVGVQAIKTDGNKISIQEADSALLLYVPDVVIREVFLQHPQLTQMVTDDIWFIEEWICKIGWQKRDITLRYPFFILGDDGATVNDHGKEYSSYESLLFGSVITRPVPNFVFDEYFSHDGGDDDDSPDFDSIDV